ncbi:MAG TPA: hypothetical protein VD695_08300 [Gaiellaceae bacterium]|nr:hypothetical protein [Gaiellaceae bacterium]
MSPESEPLRRVAAPAQELDAESEVDFGRYARAVLGKWWLLLIGALVGGALGYVYGQSGGSTYQAQATVYLGQPLSPTGTAVATLASDPSGAATIARSQAVVNEVSAEVGIPARKLRRSISAAVLGERNRQTTNVALIGVTVRGSDAEKVENAANMIAERLVAASSTYADAKAETLQQRLDGLEGQLESAEARLDQVTATIEEGTAGSSTEQLLQTNLLAVLEQQRADLADRVFAAEQLLEAAEEIERGRVVSPAAATKVNARNPRTSTIVGAFLGLVLAGLAALLWAPVARRRAA